MKLKFSFVCDVNTGKALFWFDALSIDGKPLKCRKCRTEISDVCYLNLDTAYFYCATCKDLAHVDIAVAKKLKEIYK